MLGTNNIQTAYEADLASNLVTTIRLAIVLWFNCFALESYCVFISTLETVIVWNHDMSHISRSVTYKIYGM